MPSDTLDLKVGFSCNCNCNFCVQGHRKCLGDNSFSYLTNQLVAGRKQGKSRLVLTGGEPTLRKELLGLVTRGNELGYEDIQVQTNARMLSYPGLVRALVEGGVTEFAPSLHASQASIHDKMTQTPGSHEQTVRGIKTLVRLKEEYDYLVLTNSVITKQNYRDLPALASLLLSFRVDQIQFAFVHAIGSAWENRDVVVPTMTQVRPFLFSALSKVVGKLTVYVEGVPFCILPGYAQCVSDLYIPETEIRGTETFIKDYTTSRREWDKVKFTQCAGCRFFPVCEGPWKDYPIIHGTEEFVPVSGKPVSKEEILGAEV